MNGKAFRKIGYGMYVVSAAQDDRYNGQIANTVFQVTSDPPTVAVSINKENMTHGFIQSSRKFGVTILSQDTPMTFIGRFGFRSGRDINKLDGTQFKIGQTGVPIVLDYAVGFLEAEVTQELDCGSHTIFIGRVTASENLSDAEPMTYAYYHTVKGGKSPKTAPTYIQDSPKEKPAG